SFWKKDVVFYNSTSFDSITKSNYKISLERIEKSDEQLCDIIETLRTSLSKKTINTTDRILLNLFFATILQKNKFIKSFELVLSNKYEYKILRANTGWKTVSLTTGGAKGFIKKTATWTEDGTQLLDEEVEEVSPDQSMTNNEWYKESVALCLQQNMQNREGIPKIWFTSPEINEIGPSINSRLAMAIGFDDSPFSVVSWEIDWSWLQTIISDIYRDCSVYTYILSDKYIVCKLGMESVSNRDIVRSSSLQNLPDEIKNIILNKRRETPYFQKTIHGLLVVQEYLFMYNIPLICVFNIPQSSDITNTNRNIIFLFLICFFVIVLLAILLGYLLTNPIKEISHWLENPKVEGQESPIHFWIIEYETLMNKIYSILYFWKFWTVDIKTDKEGISGKEFKTEKDKSIFIFSEEGKGGIPIETVNSLYRENIRLQRQIESLNQYYIKKIDADTKEKSKIQGFVIALRDMILISNDKNKTYEEKMRNILEIMKNALKIENVGIWKIDRENDILSPIYIVNDEEKYHIHNCKVIIENLEWSEILTISSAQQDYRSDLWTKSLEAESFIFTSIRHNKSEKMNKILMIYNKEPRNWEANEENFVIIVSKILSGIDLE
ncbi:MAG: GAF domain-containing protein, partial [Candidatus Hydrogenedens sp.]